MANSLLTGSVSPNGNLEAYVEQDDRVAFLYLRQVDDPPLGRIDFGIRTCWVRNLRPAPPNLDRDGMLRGTAPMMPAAVCAHPDGAPPLREEDLEFVWFEEGDAVALLENGECLAIIPCWSGQKGFDGYARDCIEVSPLAWPLLPENVLLERVREARSAWRAWDTGDPWSAVQERSVEAITAAFGHYTNYYAIDGGRWPPNAIVRCAPRDAVVLVTCGMQLRPQPTVEMFTQDPRQFRRIELGLALEQGLFERGATDVMGWLSGQAKYPWHFLSWFGPHHTMPCDALPVGASGRRFEAMLFSRAPVGAPEVRFPEYRGDPVHLLWMVPITRAERALAEQQGSDVLAQRLAAAGYGFIHRDREEVAT